MPTNQQLQQKINELEKENKILLDNMLKGKDLLEEIFNFVKVLNLENVFYKTVDNPDKILNIEEAKEAINSVKCDCKK